VKQIKIDQVVGEYEKVENRCVRRLDLR